MLPFKKSFNPLANAINNLSDRIDASSQAKHSLGSHAGYGDITAVPEQEIFYGKIKAVLEQGADNWVIHTFEQVYETDSGWIVDKGGITNSIESMPLYEINNKSIPVDTIVRIWRGFGNWYLTDYSSGGCGVVAVYCQGNQLMVMYNTPVELVGKYWCSEVTLSFNCDSIIPGTKSCKEWPVATQQGSKRTYLCPGGGAGFVEETAVLGPYSSSQNCEAVCNTTTTTTTTQAP